MAESPRRILVTGGADGLGRAICLKYVSSGASEVVILDIDQEKGEALERENPAVTFHSFDLSSFEDINCLTGSFDTVVCNAGISACGNFRDTPWEKELKVMEINLRELTAFTSSPSFTWAKNGEKPDYHHSSTIFTAGGD